MAIFLRVFITVCQIITPGRTARARSVRMVDAVEVYERATMELIEAHSPSPVQFAETGLQSSKTPTRVTNMVAIVRPNRTKTAVL